MSDSRTRQGVLAGLVLVVLAAWLLRVFPVLSRDRSEMGFYSDGFVYFKVTEHVWKTGDVSRFPLFNHPDGQALGDDDPVGIYRLISALYRVAGEGRMSLKTFVYLLAPSIFVMSLPLVYGACRLGGARRADSLFAAAAFGLSSAVLLRSHALFFRNEILMFPVFAFLVFCWFRGLRAERDGQALGWFAAAGAAFAGIAYCWNFFSTILLLFAAVQWMLLLAGRFERRHTMFLSALYVAHLLALPATRYLWIYRAWGFGYSVLTFSTIAAAWAVQIVARRWAVRVPARIAVGAAAAVFAALLFLAIRTWLIPAGLLAEEDARYGQLFRAAAYKLGALWGSARPMPAELRILHQEYDGASVRGLFDVLQAVPALHAAALAVLAGAMRRRRSADAVELAAAFGSLVALGLTLLFRRAVPFYAFFAVIVIAVAAARLSKAAHVRAVRGLLALTVLYSSYTFARYYGGLAHRYPVRLQPEARQVFDLLRTGLAPGRGVLADWATAREVIFYSEAPSALGSYWQNPAMVSNVMRYAELCFQGEDEFDAFCRERELDCVLFRKDLLVTQLYEAGLRPEDLADAAGRFTPAGAASLYFRAAAGLPLERFEVVVNNSFGILLVRLPSADGGL